MNYQNLEKRFVVNHPEDDHATYKSGLNFSNDLNRPFQRWCRYKEGYSVDLIKSIIKKYNHNPQGTILDPFLGSGTTIIAANEMGLKGCGFEVNPFSRDLAICKNTEYTREDIDEFENVYKALLTSGFSYDKNYKLPDLSISSKIFNESIEPMMFGLREYIKSLNVNNKVKRLLLLGWTSCIEPLSEYRKAGNGLKKRKYVKERIVTKNDVIEILNETYLRMLTDISGRTNFVSSNVYNDSCINMEQYIRPESISGIVFSPPYANCFDYTEIYKMELWLGEYVKSRDDLKKLRNIALRSNLNSNLKEEIVLSTDSLKILLEELKDKKLWDKRIPTMLSLYYSDMFRVIQSCYRSLEKEGFCCIIVGNSAYGGIIFPTDLLLADYANSIGFKVDCIDVDRYIITSSQQYNITIDNKKYLRESIVCLTK